MLDVKVTPDFEALLRNLRREGTPDRVHYLEMFWDGPIGEAISERFGVGQGLDPNDPHYARWRWIEMYRFLGYDAVKTGLSQQWPVPLWDVKVTEDTATLKPGRRGWLNEQGGPIQTLADLERFPWPDPIQADTSELEWYEKHLPDDMCLTSGCHSIFEYASWAMGYERFCFALHDDPELVEALVNRVGQYFTATCEVLLQFPRIRLLFGGDDMGFKTATMVSADFLRRTVLPWHKRLAEMAHAQGRLYLLHSCGNLEGIMEDLIEEVKLDGRHSFEDAIEPVTVAKQRWGARLALLGGIDMDFLARATEAQVRKRVRETLDVCLPGGGYCLGTGNGAANYVPVENYVAMLDEGRKYGA